MSQTNCSACGAPLDPNGRFCPSCGKPANEQGAPVSPQPPQYQPPRPQYQAPVYQAAPQAGEVAPVLGLGSYILMMIVGGIPIVGFIMLLVWAFSSNENPNKKNYARAVLLMGVIGLALGLVIMLLTGGGLFAMLSSMSDYGVY